MSVPSLTIAVLTKNEAHRIQACLASAAFADRCRRVFGYVPHDVGKRLGPFDLEFRPRLDSLTIDPGDPLDP
jgi:hypothetical protein